MNRKAGPFWSALPREVPPRGTPTLVSLFKDGKPVILDGEAVNKPKQPIQKRPKDIRYYSPARHKKQ